MAKRPNKPPSQNAKVKPKTATTGKTRSAKTAPKKPLSSGRAGSKQSVNNVQERGRRKMAQRMRRYGLAATVCLVILFGWIGVQQRIDRDIAAYAEQTWLEATHSAGFRFEELLLEGRRLTHPQDVVNAIGLEVGDPLFMVSLDDIRNRLLTLDTVKDATVSRDLSGKIAVTLIERKPFVLWQTHGRLRVMDDEGKVLAYENAENYPHLITVVGEQAPHEIGNLVEFLSSDSELAEQITAAVFVSNRRWDVHFANGIRILLPEQNPKAAWHKLASMQREHDILSQQVQAIDMRINDRVFITLPDEAADAIKDAKHGKGSSDV